MWSLILAFNFMLCLVFINIIFLIWNGNEKLDDSLGRTLWTL